MFGQAQEDGEEVTNHNFIRQALQPLVSMLLEQLTKQEPGQDRDEGIWNTCMAAGICLGLVAQCVKDEIVSLVMPYVQVGYIPPRCFLPILESTRPHEHHLFDVLFAFVQQRLYNFCQYGDGYAY